MLTKDIINFANENPVCFLSTVEKDQPRVRGMLLYTCDNENGFVLQSGKIKKLVKQLEDNPKVEICFFSKESSRMLRIEGKAEFLNDIKLKKEIYEKRTFLKDILKEGVEDPNFIVFRVKKGIAYFWTFENNLKPYDFIEF